MIFFLTGFWRKGFLRGKRPSTGIFGGPLVDGPEVPLRLERLIFSIKSSLKNQSKWKEVNRMLKHGWDHGHLQGRFFPVPRRPGWPVSGLNRTIAGLWPFWSRARRSTGWTWITAGAGNGQPVAAQGDLERTQRHHFYETQKQWGENERW